MDRQDLINNLTNDHKLIDHHESIRLKKMNIVLLVVFSILMLILLVFVFKLWP